MGRVLGVRRLEVGVVGPGFGAWLIKTNGVGEGLEAGGRGRRGECLRARLLEAGGLGVQFLEVGGRGLGSLRHSASRPWEGVGGHEAGRLKVREWEGASRHDDSRTGGECGPQGGRGPRDTKPRGWGRGRGTTLFYLIP